MIAHGSFQNGVVVLDSSEHLPEGQRVAVFAIGEAPSGLPIKGRRTHSILDIPPVSVGAVLHPLSVDDDLLSEMLEDRV